MIYRKTPKFFIKRNMQKSANTGIYSREATSQVDMRACTFGDCREGQIPRSLLRWNFDAPSACCGVFDFDNLVTEKELEKICLEVTGEQEYEYEFVDNAYEDEFLNRSYNQGMPAHSTDPEAVRCRSTAS